MELFVIVLLYISRVISGDLADTSGNLFGILHTQIFGVNIVITNIRGADNKKLNSNWTFK